MPEFSKSGMAQKMKITLFGEKFITRESICGQFPPREVGWGGIWDRFLRKMLEACFGKNQQVCYGLKSRFGLGNCTFEVILRKCEDENDAD